MSQEIEIIRDPEYRAAIEKFAKEQIDSKVAIGVGLGDAIYMIMTGKSLGLDAYQSLRGMYMVKGKAILAAQTKHAICVRHRDICKYLRLVESTHEKCTYETLRDGDPEPTRITWTIQMAQRAGLAGGPTWKAHPEAMLRNRCISSICSAVYPDLVLGTYDEDEGREIAGEYRVMVQEPVVSLPSRQAAQLPAAAPDPLAAFAPLPNEPSELDQTLIGATANAIAAINSCNTIAELQACAKALKENQPELINGPSRETLLEAHKRRRTDIEVSDLLAEAKLPGADLAALWAKAHAIKGVTEQHEKQLADGLPVQP